jgi:glutathione peroxidase
MSTAYDFTAKTIDGAEHSLADYRGKALLVVNVASKCGFTPQYAGLEALHRKFKDRGFAVLGFPCDQFGHQEPGDENEIKKFCTLNYALSFPLYAKIEVNGDNAHPLYKWLKAEKAGILGTEAIKWNFTKFLIDRNGEVLMRFAPKDTPEKIENELAPLL